MTMRDELREQADVVRRLLAADHPLDQIASLADDCTHVVIAARGTSDNAARYAQYVWGSRNRLSVGLTTPSLFGPLASPPALTGALVVGVSQSGESPDLVEVLDCARNQGRPTLVITNEPGSPLADRADVVLDIGAGPELAVAATKTYTASLAAVALVSQAIAGETAGELDGLADRVAESISLTAPEIPQTLIDSDRCVVVGRGYQLATAFEWALKLQELTYLLAQPYSAADFLHGPVAVIDEGFPVLVVATSGPTYDQVAGLAADLKERGCHVIALTDRQSTPAHQTMLVPSVAPWLAPIVAAPVMQRFAHDLALARGLDPDSPRGLTKVTRTR
jgi:glucosamine--fructose-6-phosphate aminotransferase (isomerizing)